MQKVNHQLLLESYIASMAGRERLLLHCCCAPCASYALEYLSAHFDLTVFFYNPNLFPEDEYYLRKRELLRLLDAGGYRGARYLDCDYRHEEFLELCSPLSGEPEGGGRCQLCFRQRLAAASAAAAREGIGLVTTTLTISPQKDAQLINRIGGEQAKIHGVRWLPSDFKKRGGYQRSVELSREFGLYRQDYCGCEFSRRREGKA